MAEAQTQGLWFRGAGDGDAGVWKTASPLLNTTHKIPDFPGKISMRLCDVLIAKGKHNTMAFT